MRKLVLLGLAVCFTQVLTAQTKVFSQIVGAIKTDLSEITQNRRVVGYVRLVQLEKSSKYEYNYELQIMDENLNDISKAKFTDGNATLRSVSFENDVIAVLLNKDATEGTLYFINLEGKVLESKMIQRKMHTSGVLTNLPGIGFLYHQKSDENMLIAYDSNGKKLWQKRVEEGTYDIAASPKMVGYYNYSKSGDHSLNFINSGDGKSGYKKPMPLKKGLTHNFTGIQVYGDTIFYSGAVTPFNIYGIGMQFKNTKKGFQRSVLAVKAWAPKKESILVNEANWSNGGLTEISKVGSNPENKKESYIFENSVTTSDGTTYFFANNIIRKPRIGNVVATVVTLPLVVPTLLFVGAGYNKYYYTDATIFKLTSNQRFSRITSIEQARSKKYFAKEVVVPGSSRSIIDQDGTAPYFVSGDENKISITNLNSRKTKQIPRKAGKLNSFVYPAKEGHFLLLENNNAAKTSTLSIVPLQ